MTLNSVDDSNAEDLQSSTSELSKEVPNDQIPHNSEYKGSITSELSKEVPNEKSSHDAEDKEPIEDSDRKPIKKKSCISISYDDENKKSTDFSKMVITDKNANEASDSQTNFDCIEIGKSNF